MGVGGARSRELAAYMPVGLCDEQSHCRCGMWFERRRVLWIHPRFFSSHRRRKRHSASNPYRRAQRLRFQGRAVARRVSSRSMWRNFRRRSHTRAISRKLSRCIPRNRRTLHLLGLPPTQCMQIFSQLGRRPRDSKGRKRQSPPKILPDLYRRRRRPPRMRQSTARACLMATSNKIDA